MFEEFAKKLKKKREEETVPGFKPFNEEVHEAPQETVAEPGATKSATVVSNTESSTSNLELKIINPKGFEDVLTVAEHLIQGCTVVLNLEAIDMETTTRMLDFLKGVCFPINGDVKLVSRSTYIITPSNIDVSD